MHTARFILIASFFALSSTSLAACEGVESEPCEDFYVGDIDPAGNRYTYVVDSINLPGSALEARSFGMNLDGDEQDRPDNALGQVLAAAFGAYGGDVDGPIKAMVGDGRILHLLELQARELNTASGVGVRLLLGVDQDGDASDNFSGSEPFSIDTSEVTHALRGEINDGLIRVSLGSVPLQIAMPGAPAPTIIRLDAAAVIATVSGDRIDGRIGGVIRAEEVDTALLSIVQEAAQFTIARDCVEEICEPNSTGAFYQDLFDVDGDNQVGLQELRDHPLITSLLAPDVDMFDANGYLTCGGDGLKDSLSVGLGFSAVRAELVQ